MSIRKRKKLWICFDIALGVLIVLTMLLFKYIHYIINYNLGQKNKQVLSIEYFFLITMICFVIILAAIIIYIYRLYIHLKVARTNIIYFRIFIFMLVLSFVIGGIYYSKPGYLYISKGFSDRMHREADIPEIQSWLETIDTDSLEFKQNYAKIKESEWPDFIVKLSPKDVYFERYNKDKTRARLLWGGTLVGRWGLVVGNKTMTMTISDIKEDGEYRMQFAPGAYIWHDR